MSWFVDLVSVYLEFKKTSNAIVDKCPWVFIFGQHIFNYHKIVVNQFVLRSNFVDQL